MWCSHSHDETEDAWNLYQHVERVEGLNVADGMEDLRCLFKPFARRRDPLPAVASADDGELIVKVWFKSPVTIRQLCVASCGGHRVEEPGAPGATTGGGMSCGSAPATLRCFTSPAADGLDFAGIDDIAPSQTMELPPNPQADIATPCSMKHFNQVTFVLFHFQGRPGSGATRISYLGLQGVHSHASRQVVDAKYECLHFNHDVQARDERAASGDMFDCM
mmetsp:Transcript_32964/g.94677  ORF Transcript_32964/g.94677 Transcript_32964/m.94677 type:complete len:220 (-) Transcript_32964:129-788(-)